MKLNSNKGFSLVELAIALGLITMLIGVISSGGGMVAKARLQREAQAVDNLRLAAQNYLSASSLTYAGISIQELKTAGYIPGTFDPSASNSYGGDYSVAANGADVTRVNISLSNVPESAAADLSGAFRGKAAATSYDATSKLWLVTF